MAVVIRLRREGTTNKPFYRIVATDKASKRDGKFLELLGTYDPKKSGDNFTVKTDRVNYWLSVGATCSDTVGSIIKRAAKAEAKAAELAATQAAQEAAPEAAPGEPAQT